MVKEAIAIGAYPDNDFKKELLIKQVNEVRDIGLPIAIVTHYHDIPIEVREVVDYIVYEKENILSDDRTLKYWFNYADELIVLTNSNNNNYNAVAVLSELMRISGLLMKKYEIVHYMESDIDMDIKQYINEARNILEGSDKQFIGFNYDEEHLKIKGDYGIITNVMSFVPSWFQKNFPIIDSWEAYQKISEDISNKTGLQTELIFEYWFHNYLHAYNLYNDCAILSNETRDSIIHIKNIKTSEYVDSERLFIRISETTDNHIILFLINNTDEIYTYTAINKTNNIYNDGTIPPNNCCWITYKKEDMELYVDINGEISEDITISKDKTYTSTQFIFKNKSIQCLDCELINKII